MTEFKDLRTPWSNFTKAAGLKEYEGTLFPPTTGDLSAGERSRLEKTMNQYLDERLAAFCNKVYQSWSEFDLFNIKLTSRRILFCRRNFNLYSSSNLNRIFLEKDRRGKFSPKKGAWPHFYAYEIYRMTRSIKVRSVQQALFETPCDIRCTLNDAMFLYGMMSLPLSLRISLIPSPIEWELLEVDAMNEEAFLKVQEEADVLTDVNFQRTYGSFFEYSDYRTVSLVPRLRLCLEDRLKQYHTTPDKLLRFLTVPVKNLSGTDAYSQLSIKLLFKISVASNIELDELMLENAVKDGYGRAYIEDERGSLWELDKEERFIVSRFHCLSPKKQMALLAKLYEQIGKTKEVTGVSPKDVLAHLPRQGAKE